MRPSVPDAVRPGLIVLAGRSGVGKTTVARLLAQRLGAVYLRIDTIEQALANSGGMDAGPAGYAVARAIAAENLRLGLPVVADAVNPLRTIRQAWAEVASATGRPWHLVEVVCSDETEHRRRVDDRAPDIPGHGLPDWSATRLRHVEAMAEAHQVLDTARLSPEQAVSQVVAALGLA